jgi:peptidyl-tRNA hydrolase, PTH2 family
VRRAPDEYKQAIVVVKGLGMGAGKMAAQVGHAVVMCVMRAQQHDPGTFRRWIESGQMKVVLKVDVEKELYALKAHAEDVGLTTAVVSDAGHTQLAPGTVTCLGVGPGKAKDIDAVVGHLKLF